MNNEEEDAEKINSQRKLIFGIVELKVDFYV